MADIGIIKAMNMPQWCIEKLYRNSNNYIDGTLRDPATSW
jgi:hypothetical protein